MSAMHGSEGEVATGAGPRPNPNPPPEQRLHVGEIAIYALPMTGLGFMMNLVSFYLLKFSTDVLLIAPGIIGLAFGVSRAWDAVSDPFTGYWSDRGALRLEAQA